MTHRFPLRVYYEDTDFGGIVYYANYLKFIERARSEWVREMGLDQKLMKARDGVVFAVRRVEADYLAPAHYDDELVVISAVVQATAARWIVDQHVTRSGEVVFQARVTIVAIGENGQPTRLPAELRARPH